MEKKPVIDKAASFVARRLIAVRNLLFDHELSTWPVDKLLDLVEMWEYRHVFRHMEEKLSEMESLEEEIRAALDMAKAQGGDVICYGDKIHIGDVIITQAGNENPYQPGSLMGEERRQALKDFRAGKLSEGLSAWYAPACGGAVKLTDPSKVEWND